MVGLVSGIALVVVFGAAAALCTRLIPKLYRAARPADQRGRQATSDAVPRP